MRNSQLPAVQHPAQLLVISDRILGMDVAAPLKAIMTGIELLLGRAQQWEVTAAKRVSLAAPLDTLLSLVGRWRKLELEGWRSLMKKIEQDVELAAKKVRWELGRGPDASVVRTVCSPTVPQVVQAAFSESTRVLPLTPRDAHNAGMVFAV